MRNRILFTLLTLVTLSGCVTNKKYVLLQKDDLHRSDLPLDTVVRKYDPVIPHYRLQPNDIVYVSFESLTPQEFDFLSRPDQGNFTFAQGVNMLLFGNLIEPEGTIPFPFIGKVIISGLTVFEAQDKLQQIAAQYLDKPVVTVRLINYRFTVLGEVNREGTIVVNNNNITLLEALGLAGGLTDLADRSMVKLIRKTGGQTTVQYINLLDENIIHSPYYFIQQNDVLIVPPLRQRPYRKYFGPNLSLILSSLSLLLITINLLNTSN